MNLIRTALLVPLFRVARGTAAVDDAAGFQSIFDGRTRGVQGHVTPPMKVEFRHIRLQQLQP